jgi:hypothetical protein
MCLVRITMLGLVVAVASGCGQSDEQRAAEQAAEQTRQAAETLRQAAETTGTDAAKGMEDFARAMESMAGALSGATPDGTSVEPVGFDILQRALPQMSGWQRTQPTGERMTSPIAYSQAEASYSMGDAHVEVKIVDSALSQVLFAPWSMFLASGFERQSSDGYEKALMVGEHRGFERWNTASRDGELNLVVANRFLVTIEGSGIDDTAVLREFASRIDTATLASVQ